MPQIDLATDLVNPLKNKTDPINAELMSFLGITGTAEPSGHPIPFRGSLLWERRPCIRASLVEFRLAYTTKPSPFQRCF